MRICRRRRRAARIISQRWLKYLKSGNSSGHNKQTLSSTQEERPKKSMFNRASNSKDNEKSQQLPLNLINRVKESLMQTEGIPLLNKSIPPIINVLKDNVLKKSETSTAQLDKKISLRAKRLAAEAYKVMNDYDKGGDICIIEKCYIMIGTQLREQSLVLSALQKFVDVEREVIFFIHSKIIVL